MNKNKPDFKLPDDLLTENIMVHHDIRYQGTEKISDEWSVFVVGGGICERGETPEIALEKAGRTCAEYRAWQTKPKRKLTEEEIDSAVKREFENVENPDPEEFAACREVIKEFFCVTAAA